MPTRPDAPSPLPSDHGGATLGDVLTSGSVRSAFQPIVDLVTGGVVAHEALARGPEGVLATPDALFAAARDASLLAELDHACRLSAVRGAVAAGLFAPGAVFVNVEPEVLESSLLDQLVHLLQEAPQEVRVVVEITERELATRPAQLLRTIDRVRELGWGVALDDVGAEPTSLAFMALLRPDVVKLDLAMVQGPATAITGQVMHAVSAYAEDSGARVLAEGIETEAHLRNARALGATLGQGWLFGRPSLTPVVPLWPNDGVPLALRPSRVARSTTAAASPFDALPDDTVLARAPKRLLIELSKQLEREATALGAACVVAASFQDARHLTPDTTRRYRDLAAHVGFVCALGRGLGTTPLPGVRGASLSDDDPVLDEWDLVVLSPHVATALLARDLGDDGPELDRVFEYALTHRSDTVVRAMQLLLDRVVPREN